MQITEKKQQSRRQPKSQPQHNQSGSGNYTTNTKAAKIDLSRLTLSIQLTKLKERII